MTTTDDNVSQVFLGCIVGELGANTAAVTASIKAVPNVADASGSNTGIGWHEEDRATHAADPTERRGA